MATAIALAALVISVASFGFSIFQFRALHQIRIQEKATSLLRSAHELQRRAHGLKHTIEVTDHVDDCAEMFTLMDSFIELQVPAFVKAKKHSLADLFQFEQALLKLETSIDLLQQQVEAVGKFNEEVREHEARRKLPSEL